MVCLSTITSSGSVEISPQLSKMSKWLYTPTLSLLSRFTLLPPPPALFVVSLDMGHFFYWKVTISCFDKYPPTCVTSIFSGLSKFHQEPSPQTVLAGGAARFECQIEGVPTPVITWEKDKVAVPEETR